MTSRSLFRSAFWILVALAVVFYTVGGWFYSGQIIDEAFVPDPDPIVVPQGDYELQEVQYESDLGPMDAWYLPADGTTWVIHVHGLGTTPAEAEPLFGPLQAAGYPQLAITYRNDEGQPEDPSGYYQYGAAEYHDVSAAVDYALAAGAQKIFFNSYSTGAAHTLGFMFREVRDRVIGAHFDAPNIDLSRTVNYAGSQRNMPLIPIKVPSSLAEVAKFFTSLRIGVSWKTIDYIDTARTSLRNPVLVHHGTADLDVPIEESYQLAAIDASLVRLIPVEGAGHVESYQVDPEGYVADVLSFLQSLG